MHLKLDLQQLRLLIEAYTAFLPPTPEDELEVLPPLARKLLDQAQAQIGGERFDLELEAMEASDLFKILEAQLELAAAEGDVFVLGELPQILSQLSS